MVWASAVFRVFKTNALYCVFSRALTREQLRRMGIFVFLTNNFFLLPLKQLIGFDVQSVQSATVLMKLFFRIDFFNVS